MAQDNNLKEKDKAFFCGGDWRVLGYYFVITDCYKTERLQLIVPQKVTLWGNGLQKYKISTLVLEPHTLGEDPTKLVTVPDNL